jgi:asparagine synthetase B (glutamine-hydrolysing)
MLGSLRHVPARAEHTYVDSRRGFAIAFLDHGAFRPAVAFGGERWKPGVPLIAFDGSLYDVESHAAAERVAAEYAKDAQGFLARLDGFFRLALWDERDSRLLLATDRLGNHNIYYAAPEGSFVFATELKAVLEHPSVRREVDPESVALYLSRGYVPGPRTIVAGVRKALPSQLVGWDAETRVRTHHYWRPARLVKKPGDLAEWAARTKDEVSESVLRAAAGADRIAVPFSGGIDSSIVAAVLKDAGADVAALTVAWPDAAGSADAGWSAKVAAELRIEHRLIELPPELISAEHAGRILRQFDEPVESAGRALGFYAVNQVAREMGIRSLIDGNGCEQLFNAADGSIPPPGVDPSGEVQRVRDDVVRGRVFSPERLHRVLVQPPSSLEKTLEGFVLDLEELVNASSYPELHVGAYLLRIPSSRFGFFTEVMASYCGVEERSGFRDRRLYEFSRAIPNEIKGSAHLGTPRQLIKEAFAQRLPHVRGRQEKSAAPGDFRSVPSVQPAFLALAGRAGETGLLRQEGVDRLTERYLADPLSSAGERFRAVVLFLAWHAFYIEGRDPFAEFS